MEEAVSVVNKPEQSLGSQLFSLPPMESSLGGVVGSQAEDAGDGRRFPFPSGSRQTTLSGYVSERCYKDASASNKSESWFVQLNGTANPPLLSLRVFVFLV